MMALVLTALTTIFFIVTILPLTTFEAWWVRGWDFPRLQLLFIGTVLFIIEVLLLDLFQPKFAILVSVTLLCSIYQGLWLLPYTRLFPCQVLSSDKSDPSNTVSILVANVLQTNHCYEQLLSMVTEKKPDILVTLETNHEWQKQLEKLEEAYPYTVKCPLENLYGMHVYSKFPLIDSKVQFLVMKNIPSIHTGLELPSGKRIVLHFMHPVPPTPSTRESTPRDAELLIVGKAIANRDYPVIVSGDLNDVAWSKTTKLFQKISRLLDPRIGRGMFNTFNAKYWFARWSLDHLFHSAHFVLSKIERLPKFGSDHFPVFIELVLDESKREIQQKVPREKKDDHNLVQEKMASKDVKESDVHCPDIG